VSPDLNHARLNMIPQNENETNQNKNGNDEGQNRRTNKSKILTDEIKVKHEWTKVER
jgi:hypothetical protein